MSGWYPKAVKRELAYAKNMPARRQAKTVCLHTNGGGTDNGSLFGWFNRAGNNIAAHFQVMTDGTCLTPQHRVLTADLRWVEGGSLRVGDELIAFDEGGAAIRGGRRYRRAVVESVEWTMAPVHGVVLDDETVIYTTAEHRWLAQRRESWSWHKTINEAGNSIVGTRIPRLFDPWDTRTDFEAGWFSGLLDGEGTLAPHHRLGFSQRPTDVLDRALCYLKDEGIEHSVSDVNGESDCKYVNIGGGLGQILSILGSHRPTRLVPKVDVDSFGRIRSLRSADRKVVAVYPAGVRDIVRMQTSTRTFIAEGFGMHNCEQYVPVDRQAYAEVQGNDHCVSIETQDDGHPSRPWTSQQIDAVLDICRWLGVPAQIASETGDGVNWHALYADYNPHSHDCPGTVRVSQIEKTLIPELAGDDVTSDELKAAIREVLNEELVMAPAEAGAKTGTKRSVLATLTQIWGHLLRVEQRK